MQGSTPSSNSSNLPPQSSDKPKAANGTPPSVPARTPAQMMSDWSSALDRVGLDDRAEALAFLNHVAQGFAADDGSAEAVFNDLIAHEAYDVFVEAFTAHSAI